MNKETFSKLSEILDLELADDEERLSAVQLLLFQLMHGVIVPKAYRDYMKKFSSCYVKEDYYFPMKEKSLLTPDDGMEFMDMFYNVELAEVAQDFFEEWGKQVLPIGECSGGDYICIGLKGKRKGKIYLLYHEDEQREDGLYLAADSFDEFVKSLCHIPGKLEEISGAVTNVQLSGDLFDHKQNA
ncbi:MAG: SMI1/KNR4 family protein [Ruminococcus sp.]|nr:SMI1/KNR4 family protein [Ruminococcus sp.]